MAHPVPTLYEWLGGGEALSALIARFYERVPADPILEPLFRNMDPAHWRTRRDDPPPSGKGNHRAAAPQWVRLLLETADEMELPSARVSSRSLLV
jgi:truncated hemoglobin YjbI